MLMVVSQPFFRQRQAVHGVTPTCSSHRERLTTAGPGFACVLSFDSIFTRHSLPRAWRALVYQEHGCRCSQHESIGLNCSLVSFTIAAAYAKSDRQFWCHRVLRPDFHHQRAGQAPWRPFRCPAWRRHALLRLPSRLLLYQRVSPASPCAHEDREDSHRHLLFPLTLSCDRLLVIRLPPRNSGYPAPIAGMCAEKDVQGVFLSWPRHPPVLSVRTTHKKPALMRFIRIMVSI